MNCDQYGHRVFLVAVLCASLLIGAAAAAFAQDSSKKALGKWRPKGGLYAKPGDKFSQICNESDALEIDISEDSVSGNEWSCKITKLTDTAPGVIRLNMACGDYNLGLSINDPDEREFKEIMLLRKIDEKSMFVRKSLNGKFKGPDWRAPYCPEETQRRYVELRAANKAEAEQKAAEERLSQNPWRPRDGVYAAPGPNFEDRCLKAGDAIIEFPERSVSTGADKCSVTFIRDELDGIKLFATCSQAPNSQGSTGRSGDGGSILSRSSETIILKKINDNTVSLQKSKNGNFIDSGTQLSYCGQDAQRMYASEEKR